MVNLKIDNFVSDEYVCYQKLYPYQKKIETRKIQSLFYAENVFIKMEIIHTKWNSNYLYAQKAGTFSWYRNKSGIVGLSISII